MGSSIPLEQVQSVPLSHHRVGRRVGGNGGPRVRGQGITLRGTILQDSKQYLGKSQ